MILPQSCLHPQFVLLRLHAALALLNKRKHGAALFPLTSLVVQKRTAPDVSLVFHLRVIGARPAAVQMPFLQTYPQNPAAAADKIQIEMPGKQAKTVVAGTERR